MQAKCATMLENSNAKNPRVKVICVYTADCRDTGDVIRVLSALRVLGFGGRIYYKEDAATRAGNYVPGRASLYESPGGTELIRRREITEESLRKTSPGARRKRKILEELSSLAEGT